MSLEVYDAISSHMVTLDKCLNEFNEVKKKLSKIDVEDAEQKPALKVVEAEVKPVRVSLNEHKRNINNFDSALTRFEQETQKLFQAETSFLAEDYREKVESQTRKLDDDLQQVQLSVREDNGKLKRDAAKVLGDKHTNDIARIANDLDVYEKYLKDKGVASEELQQDFRETYDKLAEKERELVKFFEKNKGGQFNATKLLSKTQRQRERAHDVAKQLKIEHELSRIGGGRSLAGLEADNAAVCTICNASSASFEIHCMQHAFCATCLMKYIKERANQNLPALCPGGCKQELFQEEIDRACELAGQPEVGSLYQRRATQRRIQPIGDTVECVNRCGNLACHKNDDEQTASCEDCQFVFCVNCSSPAHPEEPDCIKYLEKEIKAHRANQNGQDVLKTLKKLREEGNVRVCPRCKTAYQKISGCDHIRCGKCGNDFHYNSTDQNQNGARQISEQESIVTRELSDFSIASASTQSSLPSYWRRLMKHMEN